MDMLGRIVFVNDGWYIGGGGGGGGGAAAAVCFCAGDEPVVVNGKEPSEGSCFEASFPLFDASDSSV